MNNAAFGNTMGNMRTVEISRFLVDIDYLVPKLSYHNFFSKRLLATEMKKHKHL